MKYYFVICSAVILTLTSCATYKAKMQNAAITLPEIGSIVNAQGKVLYTQTEQIGVPSFSKPLKLQVKKLPFNAATYAKYSTYMAKASKINSIAYVDSLPYKPKYIQLQLSNKVAISTILNNEENAALKNYIATNAAYKIVTTINAALTEEMIASFVAADMVLLAQDAYKNMHVVLQTMGQKKKIALSELEVFSFKTASFCWGEDRYHHKKIKTILMQGDNCPKDTYKKAHKIKADKSYLKL